MYQVIEMALLTIKIHIIIITKQVKFNNIYAPQLNKETKDQIINI